MSRLLRFLLMLPAFAGFSQAAALVCTPSASIPVVHSEGIAERLGDLILTCSGGAAGATVTGNLNLFLPVYVTNRIQSNGTLDVSLTVDNGTAQPGNVPAVLGSPTSIVWNGLSITLSPTGTAVLTISNVRANMAQNSGMFVNGFVSFTGVSTLALTNTQLVMAAPVTSLFSTASSTLICPANGSPLPASISFSSLLSTGTLFNTTRVTEGYPDAFAPKSDPSNSTSDTGTRIILQFSGFPSVARLFVPAFVAGSTADVPTAAGDLGLAASGGQYTPGKGQLLLALVSGADANGAGGTIANAVPAATTSFDTISELPMSGGAGYAVYEVVDANPYVRETAQIPTWLGFVGYEPTSSIQPTENVFLAPLSKVITASPTAPIPRFTNLTPPNDCGLLGDCKANYFPHLSVDTTPITATIGVNQDHAFYPNIQNSGSGAMLWNATVQYTSGANWVRLTGAQGVNSSFFRIDILPGGLTPGVYQANIVIDAGVAGTATIPVTATVVASLPQPVIKTVTSSAAPFAPGVVPDSLVTLWGENLGGNAIVVTFDGTPADILYDGPNQINVRVRPSVTGHTANSGARGVSVVANIDGQSSTEFLAGISDLAPAIFTGGVINQDTIVNSAAAPAPTGTVIAVYATGLSTTGTITAKVHDREIAVPDYAGPAPTVPGVQQVNIKIPADLPAMKSYLWVCGTTAANPSQKVCSPAMEVWLSKP